MASNQSETGEFPVALHSRGYLRLLLWAGFLGVPVSFVAFSFLITVHYLEKLLWQEIPHLVGYSQPPGWWAVPVLTAASVLVFLAVTRLPGGGGHVPVTGLGGGTTPPAMLPGVVLAAVASLAGGAVIGPEAPLIAIGGGLAWLAVRRSAMGADATSVSVIAAAGSAAAVSAIFGNPIVAALLLLEVVGLGRRQLVRLVLPCLLSSGVGALLFTGLGQWSGLEIGTLAIPALTPAQLTFSDVAWVIPLASTVAIVIWFVHAAGRRIAELAHTHVLITTLGAGLVTGLSAWCYVLVTDRSVTDVVMSGQATLPQLADPQGWTTGSLVALLAFKAVAYAVCLGAFRGGLVFPAIFLGAAAGVLFAGVLPGLTVLSALAIGMAAGVAVTGLPTTSVVFVVLLLGTSASNQMPVVIVAVVVAMVVNELLSSTFEVRSRSKVSAS